MFTGIVSAVGRIAKATREAGNGKRETGLTLKIQARYKGLKKGESIAVNGACLTIERALPGGFTVHVVETTEGRTLFGEYAAGRPVNLERALRATDRLDRKSTRLNSSHGYISYAVFCLKKKKNKR